MLALNSSFLVAIIYFRVRINFWSKLKDVQLETELNKSYDLLVWFGHTESKIFPYVQNADVKRKIIVNEKDSSFDLQLNAGSEAPSEMLHFVIETLKKIDEFVESIINKLNSSIDMKYYNNVIMFL